MTNTITALDIYELNPSLLYSIEAAAHLAQVSRRRIALYCRHGLIAPVTDPDGGGWYFDAGELRTLRRIEHLRIVYGMNMTAIKMILGLTTEVERLREEVRFLSQL
jgi:DNA-binding transcriptional MerR regulator